MTNIPKTQSLSDRISAFLCDLSDEGYYDNDLVDEFTKRKIIVERIVSFLRNSVKFHDYPLEK